MERRWVGETASGRRAQVGFREEAGGVGAIGCRAENPIRLPSPWFSLKCYGDRPGRFVKNWVLSCIYAFQILSGAASGDGWGAIDIVRTAIKKVVGGIIQADREGFSNEDENHILWQFS